jgi:hypothetical protein
MEEVNLFLPPLVVEFLHPEAAPSQKPPCTCPAPTMIWPAMHDGITDYWDVHTIEHSEFYFSFISGED